MILACLQIYRELLSLVTFLWVHSNSKEVSYLFWQDKYPNLKTTCHIKLKFFLWTKLLENLLHAKYLTSVAVSLTSRPPVITKINSYWKFQDQFGECGQNYKDTRATLIIDSEHVQKQSSGLGPLECVLKSFSKFTGKQFRSSL